MLHPGPTSAADDGLLDEAGGGDTPTKVAKLSMLKRRQQEVAERRRVWSAPIHSNPPSLRATLNDPEELPGAEQPLQQGAAEQPGAGSSAAASPARPGLQGSFMPWAHFVASCSRVAATQGIPTSHSLMLFLTNQPFATLPLPPCPCAVPAALKVRARTARMVPPPGLQAQPPSSPQYGMDVLNDVFGPDRASLTTAWSPMRQGPGPSQVRAGGCGGGLHGQACHGGGRGPVLGCLTCFLGALA